MKYIMFPHLAKVENRIIKTYGIFAFDKPHTVRIAKDVTDDKEAISNLVNDLNANKVELVHLDDIIEDFICQ